MVVKIWGIYSASVSSRYSETFIQKYVGQCLGKCEGCPTNCLLS